MAARGTFRLRSYLRGAGPRLNNPTSSLLVHEPHEKAAPAPRLLSYQTMSIQPHSLISSFKPYLRVTWMARDIPLGRTGEGQPDRLARQRSTPPTAWKMKLGSQRIKCGPHSGRVAMTWPKMMKL